MPTRDAGRQYRLSTATAVIWWRRQRAADARSGRRALRPPFFPKAKRLAAGQLLFINNIPSYGVLTPLCGLGVKLGARAVLC